MLTPEQRAYLDNIKLYLHPVGSNFGDETVMRDFELPLGIAEQMADDFRRSIATKCYILGEQGAFDWLAEQRCNICI